MQDLLRIDQAAAKLGVSRSTLYRFTSQRKIPFVKIGSRCLFRPEQLETWLQQHVITEDSDE